MVKKKKPSTAFIIILAVVVYILSIIIASLVLGFEIDNKDLMLGGVAVLVSSVIYAVLGSP